MNKIFITACLALLGTSVKAQTAAVEFSSTATGTLSIAILGTNEIPECDPVLSTMLYPISATPATVTGLTALPFPMSNINHVAVDVDLGGGVHRGAGMIDLCGITRSSGNVLNFGTPVLYSCHYDVVSVSPTLIQLSFYP